MGVHGLWLLLSPSGKRVKIDHLQGKVLAIDVSIWVLKMIYGVISKGKKEFKNIHLVGIFKRLIRLLSLKVKPVFVFDGKPPDLKRQTLIRRYEIREKRKINLQKLAEKYIVKRIEEYIKNRPLQNSNIIDQSVLFENYKQENKCADVNDKLGDEQTIEDNDEDLWSLDSQEMTDLDKKLQEQQHKVLKTEYQLLYEQDPILAENENFIPEIFDELDLHNKMLTIQLMHQKLKQKRQKSIQQLDNIEQFSKLQVQEYVKMVQNKSKIDQVRQQTRQIIKDQQQEQLLNDEASNFPQIKNILQDSQKKVIVNCNNNNQGNYLMIRGQQQNQNAINLQSIFEKPKKVSRREKCNIIQNKLNDLMKERVKLNEIEKQQQQQEENYIINNNANNEKQQQIIQQEQKKNSNKNYYSLSDDDFFAEESSNEEQNDNSNKEQIDKNNEQQNCIKQTEQEQVQSCQFNYEDSRQLLKKLQESDDEFLIPKKKENQCEQNGQQIQVFQEINILDSKQYDDIGQYHKNSQIQEEEKIILDSQQIYQKQQSQSNSSSNNIVMQQQQKSDQFTIQQPIQQIQMNIEHDELQDKVGQHQQEQQINKFEDIQNFQTQTFVKQNSNYEGLEVSSRKLDNIDLTKIEQKLNRLEEERKEVQKQKEEEENDAEIIKFIDELSDYNPTSQEDNKDQQNENNNNNNNFFDEDNVSSLELLQEYNKFINLDGLDYESVSSKFEQVKQMLMLFGVPWVEAPSEAEAQCAYLEMHNLVDGVITDDSDVFLFGGRNIYRGIFDKSQYIQYYNTDEVGKELCLSRDQLIHIALFLGSDYTLGIKGVGIVNAMEIVASFEDVEALKRFKQWAGKADILLDNAEEHYKNVSAMEKKYKEQHKNYKKHWELPEEFPSQKVIDAYMKPCVDESKEKFQWGKPHIELLKKFCRNVFEWTEDQIEAQMEPLITAMKNNNNNENNQQQQQQKITNYFQPQQIATINSIRIKNAIRTHQNKNQLVIENQRKEEYLHVEKIAEFDDSQNQKNQIKKKRKIIDSDDEEDSNQIDQIQKFAYKKVKK